MEVELKEMNDNEALTWRGRGNDNESRGRRGFAPEPTPMHLQITSLIPREDGNASNIAYIIRYRSNQNLR